jgi:hypothetical protein
VLILYRALDAQLQISTVLDENEDGWEERPFLEYGVLG